MSEVELCPDTCKKYHTKEFVAGQLHVTVRMIYRYIARGLQVSELGGIYCPWIREFLDRKAIDVTIRQTASRHVSKSR